MSFLNHIPLFTIFFLKDSNILIRFFDELSPLILLDKKFKLYPTDMVNCLIPKIIVLIKKSLIFWKKMYVCKNKRYAAIH